MQKLFSTAARGFSVAVQCSYGVEHTHLATIEQGVR